MSLVFTPVTPGYKNTSYDFNQEFVKDFMEAWEYLSVNSADQLSVEFSSAQHREEWLDKARAYGKTKPKGEEIVVRRIKKTGSSDSNSGHLTFTMEAKSVADARHERLRAEEADRKRRRANGEELRRGKRRNLEE